MKKLLPPVLFLIFVVGIGLLHWKTSFPPHIAFPCSLLGLPLIVLGLWLSAAGKHEYHDVWSTHPVGDTRHLSLHPQPHVSRVCCRIIGRVHTVWRLTARSLPDNTVRPHYRQVVHSV